MEKLRRGAGGKEYLVQLYKVYLILGNKFVFRAYVTFTVVYNLVKDVF